MSEACKALDYPVISGNVSLYNETNSVGIKPTPTIGGVGLIKDVSKTMNYALKNTNNHLIVIGKTQGHIYQSALCYDILHLKKGPPPLINLNDEKKNSVFIRNLIQKNLTLAVHDISSGGIALAIAEMCMMGNIGAKISTGKIAEERIKFLFGEDQSRYIIEVNKNNIETVKKLISELNIEYCDLGMTQKQNLEIDEMKISIESMLQLNNKWFKEYNSK